MQIPPPNITIDRQQIQYQQGQNYQNFNNGLGGPEMIQRSLLIHFKT
jgi:hypothetical protein